MVFTGTCKPADTFTIAITFPQGGGVVTAECSYTHDGVSVWPGCDGPVTRLRTANTHPTDSAWALLPDKKRGNKWLAIPPGTDNVTTASGQLNNLGLSNASDVRTVTLVFVQPA